MNISSKSWPVQRTENAYGQFVTKPRTVKLPGAQEELQRLDEPVRRNSTEKISAQQILNKAEKDALNLLFNPPVEKSGMYGKNKVHQAPSGLFLDIKG